jgi:DNA-binding PadR family transcriptional regulator
MSSGDFLGSFEQLVILAVVRLGDDAYGMTVRQELEERTDRAISLGAVYATLDRLENKGYLKSNKRKAGAERQGRAKRAFRVKPPGFAALRNTLECVERMRKGLPELGGAM